MKTMWLLILLSLGGQAHADICEPKMSEEQEKVISITLAELAFEQQLSFVNFLAITRKNAFEEGALNTLSVIDDEMYRIISSIIIFTRTNEYINKSSVLEALDLFFKGFLYYPLTWSAESFDSIDNRIKELKNNDV